MSLPHVCLYVCSCVHDSAEPIDGVAELPYTQTSQQIDVNVSHSTVIPIHIQGGHLGRSKPPVDIKTKIPF